MRILYLCFSCGIQIDDSSAPECENCGAQKENYLGGWIKAAVSDEDGEQLEKALGIMLDYGEVK